MMINGAKVCPFCGEKDSLKWFNDSYFGESEDPVDIIAAAGTVTIVCSYNTGGCGGTGGYRDTADEALLTWNTRAKVVWLIREEEE